MQIRQSMDVADKEHRENLNKMEYKFLKEKVSSLKASPKKITHYTDPYGS